MSEWNGVTRYAAPAVLICGIALEQLQGHGKPHPQEAESMPCRPQIGGRIQLTAATTAVAAPLYGSLFNMCGCNE